MARVRKKVEAVPRVNSEDDAGTALPLTPNQTRAVVNELLVDGWPIRRRVMFMVLAFCVGNVQYLLIWGDDTALNKEIATTLLWVMAAIVGTYVFGAVWDDMNRRDTMMDYGSPYNSNYHLDQGNE